MGKKLLLLLLVLFTVSAAKAEAYFGVGLGAPTSFNYSFDDDPGDDSWYRVGIGSYFTGVTVHADMLWDLRNFQLDSDVLRLYGGGGVTLGVLTAGATAFVNTFDLQLGLDTEIRGVRPYFEFGYGLGYFAGSGIGGFYNTGRGVIGVRFQF